MPDLRLIKKVGYISTSLEKHLIMKTVLLSAAYTITRNCWKEVSNEAYIDAGSRAAFQFQQSNP